METLMLLLLVLPHSLSLAAEGPLLTSGMSVLAQLHCRTAHSTGAPLCL